MKRNNQQDKAIINEFLRNLRKNAAFLVMLSPGLILLIINCYIPMAGIVMAFQKINFKKFAFCGEWVGLNNIKAFIKSTYFPVITRNTLLYNLAFIILGTILALFFAISLSELWSKGARKTYQTIMFLPYFMSWVVISGITVAFLNKTYGQANMLLSAMGKSPINWYAEKRYWPFIIISLNLWKGAGYGSVMYLSGINNIDSILFEAAAIDGASKWQQIKYITLPLLKPLVIILTLLNIGNIFNTDIGLFYTVPQLGVNGSLIKVVSTVDTYIYTNLISGNSVSTVNFASAAALLQSIIGFVLIMVTNFIVRKIDNNYALF